MPLVALIHGRHPHYSTTVICFINIYRFDVNSSWVSHLEANVKRRNIVFYSVVYVWRRQIFTHGLELSRKSCNNRIYKRNDCCQVSTWFNSCPKNLEKLFVCLFLSASEILMWSQRCNSKSLHRLGTWLFRLFNKFAILHHFHHN